MDDLKVTALIVITSILIIIMIITTGIFLNLKRIESSLMNTTCIECQCREVPDGK